MQYFFDVVFLIISIWCDTLSLIYCQAAPPNYRWACRVQIAPDATQGGVVKVKLRPQTAVWDADVPKR
jgi:hypothetical protein